MSQVPPSPTTPPVAAPAKRPGGLTALAVLNFVFGGFSVIASLMLLGLLSLAKGVIDTGLEAGRNAAERAGDTAGAAAMANASAQISTGSIYLALFVGLIVSVLLIVSGIGYIKQSRSMGYVLGCVYAIAAILNVIINLAMLHSGFGFGAIIGLIYPVLTLILLNTTFKKCFK